MHAAFSNLKHDELKVLIYNHVKQHTGDMSESTNLKIVKKILA